MRLVCFPYAGGAAAAYRSWGAGLPESIEVLAAQLPGKGWRLREKPITDFGRLADEAAEAVLREVPEPLSVFGHSLGALLALEVVRRLESAGIRPGLLFASGRQAPQVGHLLPPIAHLDDDAFIAAVDKRYGGIPPEILADRDLLMFLLPALKADFLALEGFAPVTHERVETPIVALRGDSDPIVLEEHLLPWAEATTASFEALSMPGGHFYFNEDPSLLLAELSTRLLETVGNQPL